MSAVEALRLARENGVHLGVAGVDLILNADREPASRVLEAIQQHKAGIVALLSGPEGDWTARDWQVFFDERAGIAEFDGGQPRAGAEAFAFEWCVVEWLNRHPEASDPTECAWCGEPEAPWSAVVPFGARPTRGCIPIAGQRGARCVARTLLKLCRQWVSVGALNDGPDTEIAMTTSRASATATPRR